MDGRGRDGEGSAPTCIGAPIGRLLVVDDEPAIVQTLNRILRRRYTVTLETDPRRALARVENGETFDLVLSDISMAPISGGELYEGIVRAAPHMAERVLIMTGGASCPANETFLARWPHPVLWKPFGPDDVVAHVEATLQRAELGASMLRAPRPRAVTASR